MNDPVGIIVVDGILETVHVFSRFQSNVEEREEEVIRWGQAEWFKATGTDSIHEDRGITVNEMVSVEPDYNSLIGAVRRGFIAHWFNDKVDVWITEAG